MPGSTPLNRLGLRARLLLGFLFVLGLVGAVGIPTGMSFISRTLREEAMRRLEINRGPAGAALAGGRGHAQTALSRGSRGEPIRTVLRAASADTGLAPALE